MGSKHRLVPHLAEVFAELGGSTALDAFSGSGVVAYLLKTLGYRVTANDFLNFPAIIARGDGRQPHSQAGTGRHRQDMRPGGGQPRLHPADV